VTDFAEKAVAASLQFEAKKDAMRQKQSGDWSVTFTIAGTDMPVDLLSHSMGQRYVCVIVPVDTDETPLQKQPRKWSELKPSAQCAMRLSEPLFRTFLIEELGLPVTDSEQEMLQFVKRKIGISSRKELDEKGPEQDAWTEMDSHYHAWKIVG